MIGVISDVHANLPALHAVETDMSRHGVDGVWCLGDSVGYGPHPAACVAWMRANADVHVRGNHEQALDEPGLMGGTPGGVLRWTALLLPEEDRRYLAGLPDTDVRTAHGRRWGLWHGMPRDRWAYLTSPAACDEALALMEVDSGLFGHTHRPAHHVFEGGRWASRRTFVDALAPTGTMCVANPGSVGRPNGRPGAWWLAIDDDGLRWHRVGYDVDAVQEATLRLPLPTDDRVELAMSLARMRP